MKFVPEVVCPNNHVFTMERAVTDRRMREEKCPECRAFLSNVRCKTCSACVPPVQPCKSCGKRLIADGAC